MQFEEKEKGKRLGVEPSFISLSPDQRNMCDQGKDIKGSWMHTREKREILKRAQRKKLKVITELFSGGPGNERLKKKSEEAEKWRKGALDRT